MTPIGYDFAGRPVRDVDRGNEFMFADERQGIAEAAVKSFMINITRASSQTSIRRQTISSRTYQREEWVELLQACSGNSEQ
jgi:hypothetical protein